ncbi:MAG: hypothetical protein CVU48_06995 [Candidatus Cloacimonetes bacterium HGW-Cloacimonetes-1]|jgi:lipopolysaccharide/colanic/teichoic acid biosynthesis glycosyltransferase|nr:MAG: hypothetical protein CVU48_06995 [Candidatus Cloacimonetes bacterium HGW-Cloacimonetes-1]
MKYKIAQYSLLVFDFLFIIFAFLFVAWLKNGTKLIIIRYARSLIPFVLIWMGSSLWGGKYSVRTVENGSNFLKRILKCDVVAALVVFVLMYILNKFYYSRFIVLGTMLGVTVIEIFVFLGIYYTFRFHKANSTFASTRLITRSEALEESQGPKFFVDSAQSVPTISSDAYIPDFSKCIEAESMILPLWQNYLADNPDLFSFINDFIELSRFSKSHALILNSETYFNIQNEEPESRHLFLNLHKINDYRRLNLYFIKVNEMLQPGGVFICRGETIAETRNRFCSRFTPYLGMVLYGFDFLIRRVLPKLPILQGWYFALTKGNNRALSETEMLGRFYFCGFELIHKREIDGIMNFILKKVRSPRTDPHPTYGPLIRLKRRGKDGKLIYVKKLRTMHPYSEYLQHYVHQTNDLQDGGKFKDDFRVTSWGKVIRKLWIDELPQFINFFHGELGIVGVRALSEHYFNLYPADMRELRLRVKPGLLPPFYADMPVTFDEIVESERRYILQKLEKPFATDWKYFWKAVYNILIKRVRSN